jgi:hypothetical protein
VCRISRQLQFAASKNNQINFIVQQIKKLWRDHSEVYSDDLVLYTSRSTRILFIKSVKQCLLFPTGSTSAVSNSQISDRPKELRPSNLNYTSISNEKKGKPNIMNPPISDYLLISHQVASSILSFKSRETRKWACGRLKLFELDQQTAFDSTLLILLMLRDSSKLARSGYLLALIAAERGPNQQFAIFFVPLPLFGCTPSVVSAFKSNPV